VTSVQVRAETAGWFRYDLPQDLIGIAFKGRYRGQEQKWFLLDFDGEDSEIEIIEPGGIAIGVQGQGAHLRRNAGGNPGQNCGPAKDTQAFIAAAHAPGQPAGQQKTGDRSAAGHAASPGFHR
jgi:hypothetical protein